MATEKERLHLEQDNQPTFIEAFGGKPLLKKASVVVIIIVVIGSLLFIRHLRTTINHRKPVDTLFVERFEGLLKPQLYPVVWRSGVFLRSTFNEDFSEWTLTISSSDWQRRSQAGKKDLVALIWNAYRGTRERAGGNPDQGMIVIKTEKGEVVAEASSSGIKVIR